MDPFLMLKETYKDLDNPETRHYARIIFTIMCLLLALWLWSLYAIIRYWSEIPLWAKIVAIIGMCSYAIGGPVISLIVIYASRE